MSSTFGAILTVFGWGVVYFIGAVPFGVFVLHMSPALAAISAWAGYTAIAAAMLVLSGPARQWLVRKFKIPSQPDPAKLFWRVWLKYGLPGLALLAPVTCGPYIAALVAILLGEKPLRLMAWIAFGAVPYCILFAILAAYFPNLLPKLS